jgi:glyoxalase/bleomycin resistance protein/dioxygenase superfamily protein
MPTATIDELTVADEPARWAQLGFEVCSDRAQIGRVHVRLIGDGTARGIVGWSLRGISGTALDGLPTTISTRPVPEPADPHPNGVLVLDHVVAMTPALDRTAAALQAAGLDLRRIREEPTPAGAPRQAFFRLGEEILEVVQEPEEVVARAGGEDRATRFWGLALTVEDLERTAERMAPHVGEIRTAVQPGRRIATLRRSAGLAVPVALMSAANRAAEVR